MWRSIDHGYLAPTDTCITQFLHLRLREHLGRGRRKIVRSRRSDSHSPVKQRLLKFIGRKYGCISKSENHGNPKEQANVERRSLRRPHTKTGGSRLLRGRTSLPQRGVPYSVSKNPSDQPKNYIHTSNIIF